LVPGEGKSALEIVSQVTPHGLPPRNPISKRRRDDERKWVGNLVRSQLLVLNRMKETYPEMMNWEECIAKMCLQRRPRHPHPFIPTLIFLFSLPCRLHSSHLFCFFPKNFFLRVVGYLPPG